MEDNSASGKMEAPRRGRKRAQEENGKRPTASSSPWRWNRNKMREASLALVGLCACWLAAATAAGHEHQHQHQHQHGHQHHHHSVARLCGQLPGQTSRHLRLCRLSQSSDADEALSQGAARALGECRSQFRAERWNCTHAHGDHGLLTGELAQSLGNRESGFVQAIVAAGIVHSIATACSLGALPDCACDRTRVGLARHQDEKWKWGGCSGNIRHGTLFAKHLVELLDAVHSHAHAHTHGLRRRALAKRAAGGQGAICAQAANITQAAHLGLIRSLLSSNSLEKHHEFRLAMNMHNNKIGRMAVAKNMEFRCRCHGLSGSCSLKTCWQTLPDFQVIGAYLRRKYDASVHLPSAVDLNKLIPMMDRNEIGNILSSQLHNSLSLELAQSDEPMRRPPITSESTSGASLAQPANPRAPSGRFAVPAPASLPRAHEQGPGEEIEETDNDISEELPSNIAPMSQQQYQALLRDMKLCNTSAATVPYGTAYLTTRDAGHHKRYIRRLQHNGPPPGAGQRQQQAASALGGHNGPSSIGGHQLKSASQHLSQLLQTNREELIYLHKSPDYCRPDSRHGFGGIQSRVCNPNPSAPDSCDKLCCGLGYTTRNYKHTYDCNCAFQYCCFVRCSQCERQVEVHVCN